MHIMIPLHIGVLMKLSLSPSPAYTVRGYIKRYFLQIVIVFILPSISFSATISEDIADLCQDNPIILLGEKHHQPDSQKLIIQVVQYYINKGAKVFLGLEIPSDKQTELNQTLAGGTDFSFIHSIINHVGYEEMVHALGRMKEDVFIKAIDARAKEVDRETAMYQNIMLALSSRKYDKIIVLVGNNHTIKNIKWHKDVSYQGQLLAGKLISGDGNPCSIRQVFTKPNGNPELIKIDTEASVAMAMKEIWHNNHSREMTGDLVCDAIVEWK
jgi:hypothetical protein